MKILSFLLLFLVSGAASADVSLKTYKENPNSGVIKVYLQGVGDGYQLANIQLVRGGQAKPIYCPPTNVGLNADNYIAILDAELKKVPYDVETPISVLLGLALNTAFPCK